MLLLEIQSGFRNNTLHTVELYQNSMSTEVVSQLHSVLGASRINPQHRARRVNRCDFGRFFCACLHCAMHVLSNVLNVLHEFAVFDLSVNDF